jgi:hypothetical protein
VTVALNVAPTAKAANPALQIYRGAARSTYPADAFERIDYESRNKICCFAIEEYCPLS